MKTIVQGKKVDSKYKVEFERDKNDKLVSRPRIRLENEDIQWEEILTYDGEPQSSTYGRLIFLDEDEVVRVENEIFNADLGCWIQRVDKTLEEKDNIEICKKTLDMLRKEWNAQMIENDSKAKAYCDLHKLDYAETDYDELMEIIEPKAERLSKTIEISDDFQF